MPLMLPTILKNVFSKYATRCYPVEPREAAAGCRGHIQFDKSKCIYCGSCMRKCPAVAIEVEIKKKELTFYAGRCIICNACVEACPKDVITLEKQWRKPFDRPPVESFRQEGVPEKPEKKDAAPVTEKKAEEKAVEKPKDEEKPKTAEEPKAAAEPKAAEKPKAEEPKAEETAKAEEKPAEKPAKEDKSSGE